MIKGLYETHVQVSNLENAIQFYTEVLGLQLATGMKPDLLHFYG